MLKNVDNMPIGSNLCLPWADWIAEWYNTWLWTLECCSLGSDFAPRWGQKLFWLKCNIYAKELSEEDEIKTGNTIINPIICLLFVNLCCLWKLENLKNGNKIFFLKKLICLPTPKYKIAHGVSPTRRSCRNRRRRQRRLTICDFFEYFSHSKTFPIILWLLSPSLVLLLLLLHLFCILQKYFLFYFIFISTFMASSTYIGVAFSTRRVWTLLLLLLLLLQAFFNHFEKISNNVLRRWELFNTTTSG